MSYPYVKTAQLLLRAVVIIIIAVLCGIPHILYKLAFEDVNRINDEVDELRRKYDIPREGD